MRGDHCHRAEKTPDLDRLDRLWNGTVVDMGAYEAHKTCPGEVVLDGVVDVDDLLAVIGAWGSSGGPADIAPSCEGDGTVNVNDMLAVINNWGDLCAGGTRDVGSLSSVQDCMDMCSEDYEPYSDPWDTCVNRCVDALCAQGILHNCD
jgi:hypothetical protein